MSIFRDPETPLTEDQLLMRKRVYHQVTNEPETFHMFAWENVVLDQAGAEMCGTTRCIAGWAVEFERRNLNGNYHVESYSSEGIRLLGLTRREYGADADVTLFSACNRDVLERLRKLAEEP